ncbi:NACHT domain-containing protein [Sphingobacterium athyrii]|uniref:NACHT domain-containing protein n=1 Tax=Sphingobacterium athyrii TaxID=2152717 RepID=A0A363NWW9_9SPHI|nr:NACHT domain-containing protein [Sphingobacterium athyrii]PUV25151.1 hypothetical protein DCO56_09435 [Sphingobacterium athyrii]
MKSEYYELRYIETSTKESNTFSLFDESKERLTLLDLVYSHDRILLLGNPGIGKTTELKHLFKILWEEKNVNKLVPLFVNVKNFRQTSTIDDIIQFDGWKKMPSVIFIFDGLDEIGNIQDFISELENFMSKYSKLKLKFLISCRTNIYQKYLINISKFEIAYLKNLSYYQIDQILKEKFKLEIPHKEVEQYFTLLQTPFNLDLFASYYAQNGKFPDSQKDSWELFLNEQIENARLKLIKRFSIPKALMTSALQQVAVTNELMQQNAIEEEDLLKLLGNNGIEIFQELPFITKLQSTDSYVFIHKNYQEYFAAQYISSLSDDEIIKFISADSIYRIKPSLFNTTTFLLNILEGEKLDILKKWLFDYEIEILFFADSNRINPALQNEIFESYFKDICINKTFWISHNGKIPLNHLAKFAGFDFLIKEIRSRNNQNRPRVSALEVLSHKSLLDEEKNIVKEEFLKILTNEERPIQAEILRSIKSQNLHKEDPGFLLEVLQLTKNSGNRDIAHQIISIYSDLEDFENDDELLISEVKYYFSARDNTIRGTEHHIAHMILSTNDRELHLKLLSILFDDNYGLNSKSIFYDNFNNKLIERAKIFSEDYSYVIKLTEIAFAGDHRITNNPVLQNLLVEIEITPEIIVHILKKEHLSTNVLYSICTFLNKPAIDSIVNSYETGELIFTSPKNIESFRNWLSYHSTDLAFYLEDKFVKTGYIFSSPLKTEAEIQLLIDKRNAFQLYNFNLLFCKNEIIEEIKLYFKKHDVVELSNPEFQKLFFKWYDEFGYHGVQYTIHTVIETALRRYNEVSSEKIINLFNDPYFYLSVIKTALGHSSLKIYTIVKEHILLIDSLTKSIVPKIDFKNVVSIDPNDPGMYTTTKYYRYLKIVLYFDLEYNIQQNKEFYLNALEFGNISSHSFDKENSFIDHVLNRIGDEEVIKAKVSSNILNGDLIYFAKLDHINYAINKELSKCYKKIGEYLIDDQSMALQDNIFEKYLFLIKDPLKFLKSYCKDPKTFEFWYGIKLIKKYNLDNQFILDAALNYLATDEITFVDDAINILFFLNYNGALLHYSKFLEKTISTHLDSSGTFPNDLGNYTILNELNLYESLFNMVYTQSDSNSFYLNLSRKFITGLTSNLSDTEQGYIEIQQILLKIKDNLLLQDYSKVVDHKLFYVNDLIETSNNSHLKSKSTKLSFKDAISLLK